MQFLAQNQQLFVDALTARIASEMAKGRRVLWLVSGGSNVDLEVAVMRLLSAKSSEHLERLAILPMDERYGPPGHKDSNFEALRVAGFESGAATWVDVLTHDQPFKETIGFYNDVATAAFENAGVVIGQFGLGSDGHTAGILPNSPACDDDSANVLGYKWKDYTRLTLSARLLRRVNVGYVAAYGEKRSAIERLKNNTESLRELPSRLLYEIPEAYIYNDTIESEG